MSVYEPAPDIALALAAKEEFAHAEDLLRAFARVLPLRDALRTETKIRRADFPRSELEKLFLKGEPVRYHGNFRLGTELLVSHSKGFLDLFTEINSGAWAANRDAICRDDFPLAEMFESFVEEKLEPLEKAAEGQPFSLPVLASFLQQVLKGWFIAFRDAVWPELPMHAWGKGYCPVCASFAAMGERDGEGNRNLFCHLCDTRYPYPWGECPICADPAASIKVLELPEKAGYTLALCEKCDCYVKHVDRSRVPDAPAYPFVDLVTFDIDVLAQKQGYKKPTLSSFGI
ncbi:MAG: formate dehydrogenase accessory protein FdhE [Planctomycetota bacterium]|nr:MAG: formate dehydrogenase accessory protein FdhE [Planctomycetota bacterium]